MKSLRKGISQMIPEPYLNCLSGEDLEVMVCGRPKVDVELLKKHTKYSGSLNESSQRVIMAIKLRLCSFGTFYER